MFVQSQSYSTQPNKKFFVLLCVGGYGVCLGNHCQTRTHMNSQGTEDLQETADGLENDAKILFRACPLLTV